MKLPNGDKAFVPPEKLTGYSLNPEHPVGKHKARVFARALGITAANVEVLQVAVVTAAATGEASVGELDQFGQRYSVDFSVTTGIGSAVVRSTWIIRPDSPIPALTSCYVLE